MKYRPELDGLRAVAVVSVILYHAKCEGFQGGFVGVDVFFVISGFLITRLIHEEIQNGSFSILSFYERRMRRILPALYFVIFWCILLSLLYMLPLEMIDFGSSVKYTILFSSNIFFSRSIGYFTPNVDSWPLIHTWSLSLEEQFYFVFPIFMIFMARRGAPLIFVLAVSSAFSFALAEWASRTHPVFNFYLLPTRAWELGVGAIVALSPLDRLRLPRGVCEAASIAGLSAIALTVTLIDHNFPFPGVYALGPVIGAALLIQFAHEETLCGRLLSFDPVVRIGLLSYSAYLWHQPLFAFARLVLPRSPSSELMLLLSAAAFCLAYFSWRYVELPCRDRRRAPARQVALGVCAAGVALFCVGVAIDGLNGLPGRYSPSITAIAAEGGYRIPRAAECYGDAYHFIEPSRACDYHPERPARIAIWGDSHSASIAGALADRLDEEGASLKQFSFSACPPFPGVHFLEAKNSLCISYNKQVISYIRAHRELETIILYARWPVYMDGYGYDNGEGGRVDGGRYLLALPSTRGREFAEDPGRVEAVGAILRADIEELSSLGRRVVLVYPTPEMGRAIPRSVARRKLAGGEGAISVSYKFFQDRTFTFRDQIDRLPDSSNLLRVRAGSAFCSASLDRCIGEIGDKPLYFDDNHLNARGASLLARLIVEEMKRKGWL